MSGGADKGGTATRLLVFLLLFTPAALLAYVGYRLTERNLTAMTIERRDAIAQLSATALQAKFDRLVDVGVSLASRPAFREDAERGDWESALARVVDVPSVFPEIERLVITSTTATVLADTLQDPAVLGRNFAERDWFHGVSKTWKPYVSEVYKRTGTPQKNVVSAAVPVRGADDSVIAILVLQLPLERFFDWSDAVDVGHMGQVYYVDQYGHVASHPDHSPQEPIVDYSAAPAVQRALAGERGTDILPDPIAKQDALVAWARVPSYGWGVVLSQNVRAAFAERDATLRSLLIRNLVYLLLILIAGLALMRLITRLDRQLQRERTFLGSLGEGVVVTDEAGLVTYMNPAGLRIFRMAPEDLLGKPWTEVAADPTDLKGAAIPDEDRAFRAAQRGQAATVTYRYVRHDGTSFPALVTTAPIMFERRVIGVINVFRDITKETELEHERAELLSIASHQMRTPLTAMRWTTEMLLRGEAGKLTREQRGFVSDLLENNGRLTGLVNDMLNVARLEAGQLAAAPGATDLAALLKEASKEVAPLAKEKKQALETRLPRKSMMITLDARMFKQAVLNLLSNAIKYTPERGRVLLELLADDDAVHVRVQDTGIGIPADQQDQIFRKFFRAENAIASGAEGTGLGLYVVKKIVEQAGGTVAIESVRGEGSTFIVTLPLKRA